MSRGPAPRVTWLGAAAILVVAALVALAAILRGDFSETDGRILGTLGLVLYTGGALFAGLAVVERGRPIVGWSLVAGAPICFLLVLPAIWSVLDESGDYDMWRWAWTGVLALVAGSVLATALLLGHTQAAQLLALVTGAVAGIATTLSIAAVWTESDADGWIQAIAALWILTVLGYVLVPVVDRFGRTAQATEERVLATLGEVELVATRAGSVDPRLAPGERLQLRHRA